MAWQSRLQICLGLLSENVGQELRASKASLERDDMALAFNTIKEHLRSKGYDALQTDICSIIIRA
jgi:hypothetical protein